MNTRDLALQRAEKHIKIRKIKCPYNTKPISTSSGEGRGGSYLPKTICKSLIRSEVHEKRSQITYSILHTLQQRQRADAMAYRRYFLQSPPPPNPLRRGMPERIRLPSPLSLPLRNYLRPVIRWDIVLLVIGCEPPPAPRMLAGRMTGCS
ncbi:hypothetical protein CEXT_699961 [Caerostris extrusa]|uniref:Ribosomal protein S14 n=1 Tax=Caerostris extrusa TaxID=172846 RepID=A0AAV4UIS6_CAEEX|nr:hypothetical protein CEXT_699961 [Caerostris extrusa]